MNLIIATGTETLPLYNDDWLSRYTWLTVGAGILMIIGTLLRRYSLPVLICWLVAIFELAFLIAIAVEVTSEDNFVPSQSLGSSYWQGLVIASLTIGMAVIGTIFARNDKHASMAIRR